MKPFLFYLGSALVSDSVLDSTLCFRKIRYRPRIKSSSWFRFSFNIKFGLKLLGFWDTLSNIYGCNLNVYTSSKDITFHISWKNFNKKLIKLILFLRADRLELTQGNCMATQREEWADSSEEERQYPRPLVGPNQSTETGSSPVVTFISEGVVLGFWYFACALPQYFTTFDLIGAQTNFHMPKTKLGGGLHWGGSLTNKNPRVMSSKHI